MANESRCIFRCAQLPIETSSVEPTCHLLGVDSFSLWQPRQQCRSRMASISSAFLQRKQQEQRPRAVGLFSVAEAAAASSAQHDFRIIKIQPDGRCMFRALASGMSYNQGFYIVNSEEEEADADGLRLAVRDALCRNKERSGQFDEAMYALKIEATLPTYCSRLEQPSFWGGNVEMLVISKMLKQPITVYTSQTESGVTGGGFVPIAKYGDQYEGRKPVSLLYRNGNHYDLLV